MKGRPCLEIGLRAYVPVGESRLQLQLEPGAGQTIGRLLHQVLSPSLDTRLNVHGDSLIGIHVHIEAFGWDQVFRIK